MEELPKKIIYETTIVCRMYLLSLGLVKDYTISQLTLDAVVSNAMADMFLTILSEDSRTTRGQQFVSCQRLLYYTPAYSGCSAMADTCVSTCVNLFHKTYIR